MPTFDVADLNPTETYGLLSSLVVPRPIAWVGTRNHNGSSNLAPYSFFGIISTAPPVIHITCAGATDTYNNIQATNAFTVSLVNSTLVEQMHQTSVNCPPDVDEFDLAKAQKAETHTGKVPYVANAPAVLECTLRTVHTIGNGHMMFGNVERIQLDNDVWQNGVVNLTAFDPVGRTGERQYVSGGALTFIETPLWTTKDNTGQS